MNFFKKIFKRFEKPFDWQKYLENYPSGIPIKEAYYLSRRWNTCAVGTLYWKRNALGPEDAILTLLGIEFSNEIKMMLDFPEKSELHRHNALKIIKNIKERVHFLKTGGSYVPINCP